MAGWTVTLEMEVQWAKRTVAAARQKLLDLEREGKSYYDGDEDLYSSSLRHALFNARRTVKSAERKLVRAQNKLAKQPKRNPLGSKHKAMAKKRRTRTAAQQRATRAMLAANKKRRTKKKVRRRNPTIRGTYQTARAALRTPRKPTRGVYRNPVRKLGTTNDYGIKGGAKWFDGAGWTTSKANACKWGNLNACKRIAQKVSDNSGKIISVHTM